MKKIILRADSCSGNVRIDKYLAASFSQFTRGEIQKWLEKGSIFSNGEVLNPKSRIYKGDTIEILDASKDKTTLSANPIHLEVEFEDDSLMVINKPSGMVVHPGSNTGNDTLVHALIAHCGDAIKGVGDKDRPGIVHRLDKDTSGLIVVAKNSDCHSKLQSLFSNREVYKEYECLVVGHPNKDSGVVEVFMGRHPTARVKMAVLETGRYSKTEWSVLKKYEKFSHLLCRIHTGRTHQIRVHMQSIGHSILGDQLYGYKTKFLPNTQIPRFLLHAKKLAFRHPKFGKELEFSVPVPEDFQEVLSRAKLYK